MAGPNASERAGRGFGVLPLTVLLPVTVPGTEALGRTPGADLFDGDGERGGCGSLLKTGFDALGNRLDVRGVKPKPPRDVLVAGFALDEVGFAVIDDLPTALAKVPSLVPGRLLRSLSFLLRLEAGLSGGPIGLSIGEKKLDLRLSFGVVGMFWMLSIVRSLKEGLECIRVLAGRPNMGPSRGSVGDSS